MGTRPSEKWYVAVLVFESRVRDEHGDEDGGEPGVDVQYRLVRAVDAESAYQRPRALGEREGMSYANAEGGTCTWRSARLHDLRAIDDRQLGHGTEVYGFIARAAEDWVVGKEGLAAFRVGDAGAGEA